MVLLFALQQVHLHMAHSLFYKLLHNGQCRRFQMHKLKSHELLLPHDYKRLQTMLRILLISQLNAYIMLRYIWSSGANFKLVFNRLSKCVFIFSSMSSLNCLSLSFSAACRFSISSFLSKKITQLWRHLNEVCSFRLLTFNYHLFFFC